MSDDWFTDWAVHHAIAFSMHAGQHAETIASWRDGFLAGGYTPEELYAATTHMIAYRCPAKPWDHLQEIQAFVQARRAQARRAQSNTPSNGKDRGRCEKCCDSGWVIVPHPAFVRNGEWTPHSNGFPTAAVTCSCHAGVRTRTPGADNSKALPMSLAEFEQICPSWREWLDWQREATAQAIAADSRRRVAAIKGEDKAFREALSRAKQRRDAAYPDAEPN